ncbi:nascent polypeptide-associated complex protein [Methanocalculus sp. MC3]
MMPGGMNPRKMKQMMNKLGMSMDPIEGVTRVTIEAADGRYIFEDAEVVAMTMQGQTTYQLTGTPRFEAAGVIDSAPVQAEITDADIELVAMQANVSPDAAKAALVGTNGDIAEAIMKLGGQ